MKVGGNLPTFLFRSMGPMETNNSLNITVVQNNAQESNLFRYSGHSPSEHSGSNPSVTVSKATQNLNDTTGQALQNTALVLNIKDTTGAILDRINYQLGISMKGLTLSVLDSSSAGPMSLQVGAAISRLGSSGMVQGDSDVLRLLQS